MTKTQDTLLLENALNLQSREKREYGCEEVTIGFLKDGHGDEIVDYMTMDANDICKCYELKVTLADLKTDNKKSFYGDYNYLVVSDSLYAKNPVWDNYIPPYAGILAGEKLVVKRNAKKREVSAETRDMLKSSLLRSVYWKMQNYKDAGNLENYRQLQKELNDTKQMSEEQGRQQERMLWTYQDYEHYYQKNHQEPGFTIEQAAKQQRAELAERSQGKYTWKEMDGRYCCPVCGKPALHNEEKKALLSNFCPYCGADLRILKK